MTREEAIEELRNVAAWFREYDNYVQPHKPADSVLCDLLKSLGYEE